MKKKRVIIRGLIAVAAVLGISALVVATSRTLRANAPQSVPTVRVQRGDVELRVYTNGELRPVRTAQMMAPPVSGTLQIIHLWNPAKPVKAGDIVVEFDPSEQEFRLEQSRFDLADADEQITKANADAAVQAAQDKVALLSARFDVRRAELDVSRNELLSSIDQQKNQLALQEAKRRLAQLEQDVTSRASSSRASLAVLQEKRNKAILDMEQAQRTIASLQVKSPIDGVVSIQENRDATGGFFTTGMVIPEFREGDLTRSGRVIAEVQDGQMEVQSKVLENDRANITSGQAVEVKADALPGVNFSGKVKTIAGLASRGMWFMGDATRTFDTTFQIDAPDQRLRTAQTVQVVIAGNPLKSVLYVPTQAVFEKNGKSVVFEKTARGFEPHEVKVLQRTETRVVLDGMSEGQEVSLLNPEAATTVAGKAAAPPSIGGGR